MYLFMYSIMYTHAATPSSGDGWGYLVTIFRTYIHGSDNSGVNVYDRSKVPVSAVNIHESWLLKA